MLSIKYHSIFLSKTHKITNGSLINEPRPRPCTSFRDQDDLVDVGLVDLGVAEDLLDGVEGASEEVLAQLLESSTSENGAREVWN